MGFARSALMGVVKAAKVANKWASGLGGLHGFLVDGRVQDAARPVSGDSRQDRA